VTTDPAAKDPALTAEGSARAARLAEMLSAAGVTAIYTTPFTRTRNTAAPLAARAKLTPIEVSAGATFAADMAGKLRAAHGGTIVVVGHTNTTHDTLVALGIADAPTIDESDYGNLFIVTFTGNAKPSLVHLRY
jgi:phosphohistidine phosphatase SixA